MLSKNKSKIKSVGDKTCVVCFNVLGIDSRMKIYLFLKKSGKTTVSSIVDQLTLTQPTVSYHLSEMKKAGILKSKRVGKEIFYSLSDTCKTYHQDCVLKTVDFPK